MHAFMHTFSYKQLEKLQKTRKREAVVFLGIQHLQQNRIYVLQCWRRIFVALSYFVFDTEEDI